MNKAADPVQARGRPLHFKSNELEPYGRFRRRISRIPTGTAASDVRPAPHNPPVAPTAAVVSSPESESDPLERAVRPLVWAWITCTEKRSDGTGGVLPSLT